jgi:hypothetical protein
MSVVAAAMALVVTISTAANDSSASVAAGGITFTKQTDIELKKEQLTISPNKVAVAYDFYNSKESAITTTVAFPMPEYGWNPIYGSDVIKDFTVKVNGEEIKATKDVRAFVEGKDLTEFLLNEGVSIEDFGGTDLPDQQSSLLSLPNDAKERLLKHRLISWEPVEALWTVRVTYYWEQTFPAKRLIHVNHSYIPINGANYFTSSPEEQWFNSMPHCSNAWQGKWDPKAFSADQTIFREWVDYILQTANNWKGAIGDFELRISLPAGYRAMLCSDLLYRKIIDKEIVLHKRKYSPPGNLTVCFFYQRQEEKK